MDEELTFLVQEAPEGGYTARALGMAIFTAADDLDSLREQICDAVRCHFGTAEPTATICLRFVSAAPGRISGLHRGSIWVRDDFDEPLPDDFWTGREPGR